MKNALVLGLLVATLGVRGQEGAKPEFLPGPVSWQFERFPLPPVFSASFPYKGVEELRFAPGMFKKDSADYFSYAFVARLDNAGTFGSDDVKNYLLIYFKGLCASTAKQRNLSVDTTKINVSVAAGASGAATYDAVLNVFGVFADGAPVTLNAEVRVLADGKGRTYLVFIASPQGKTHSIWQELYAIRKGFSVSAN
jgi:hypothetical protein